MTQLRAFVGHSFNKEDAEVVSAFLQFFSQLANANPNFSWVHAEEAKPRELSDKVLSLVTDKNLFIGICTRKELVIDENQLQTMPFVQTARFSKYDDYTWKTSDWIIQEIGLAIGKEIDVILFVEDKVRKPGGLQGDIEYIPFQRQHPQESFGKFLEMISALSPKVVPTSTITETGGGTTDEKQESVKSAIDQDWTTPKPAWKRSDYSFAMFKMIIADDADGASRVGDAFLATDEAKEGDSRAVWDAEVEYLRLRFGKNGRLDRLKELTRLHPDNHEIARYLGKALAAFGDYPRSAIVFDTAATKAFGIDKLRLMASAAGAHMKARDDVSASRVLSQMKCFARDYPDGELEYLDAIIEVSEIRGNQEVTIAAMERASDLYPSDVGRRFNLAFKYSEFGYQDMALFHYLKIPHAARQKATWNNIGWECDQLSLPAKAVDAYKTAIDMGETLAMSNLAGKFVDAGFLSEARNQCERAMKFEDFHKSVPSILARILRIPDEEDARLKPIQDKSFERGTFYTRAGTALVEPDMDDIPNAWIGPECSIRASVMGKSFLAEGIYERKATGLLSIALVGGALTSGESAPARYQIHYSGTIQGRTISGRVVRRREGETQEFATLLTGQDDPRVLIVVDADQMEMAVMEWSPGTDPKYYTWTRQINS